jgi:glycosyltransferase involved in cell wall biosynthesis
MSGPVYAGGFESLKGPMIAAKRKGGERDPEDRDPAPGASPAAGRVIARDRILLIGPLPPPECGTSIPFQALIDYLRESSSAELAVISSTSGSKRGIPLVSRRVLGPFFRITSEFLKHAGSCNRFVFYGSQRFAATAGALYTFLAGGLLRKDANVYIQGGGFDVYYRSLNPFSRAIVRSCFRRARAVAVQTQQLHASLSSDFPNLVVLPNWSGLRDLEETEVRASGSDDRAAPKEGFDTSPGRPAAGAVRFLYLGQVKREKGIAALLAAFAEAHARLDEEGRRITLDIFGPVVDTVIDEAAVSIRALPDAIAVRGDVPHDQIAGILREHDVLVLPTAWRTEGYPAVVIEAMAFGLPVIATRFRALPEIVIDGSTGLLCEPDDVESLAECMSRLARDPKLRSELGRNGRAMAGRFDAAVVLPELCRAFGIRLAD